MLEKLSHRVEDLAPAIPQRNREQFDSLPGFAGGLRAFPLLQVQACQAKAKKNALASARSTHSIPADCLGRCPFALIQAGKLQVGSPVTRIDNVRVLRDRKSTRLNSSHPSISY